MALDHSTTYRTKALRHLPHRMRLKSILAMLGARITSGDISFADFGCSNGYITDIIATRFAIQRPHGFDYSEEHAARAREAYPAITFGTADLNSPDAAGQFDLVTCFETLEHVGELENALNHLVSATAPGGLLFISVPVEIGLRGLVKFVAKSVIYRSSYAKHLRELSPDSIGWAYFFALLFYRDISRFRDRRARWGTHYGFDYRVIDRYLAEKGLNFRAVNRFTSRFYLIDV